MREHFKDKWTPKPSAELTANLRQECAKYQAIVKNATNADKVVKENYNNHKNAMEFLSKTDDIIANSLPKVQTSGKQASPVVLELRQLLEEAETIKAEREVIEGEFTSPSQDMAAKFLSALAADGTITDLEGITSNGLEEKYNPLRQQVENSLERQQALIAKIKEVNDQFVIEKTSGQTASEREKMLKDLAAAYDVYTELTSNLKEGTKFYNDLTEILLKYQSKISDLVFARKTEKEDLSRELQQSLANSPVDPVPNAPKHHEAQASPTPPARPTPPSRPSRPPRKMDAPETTVSQPPVPSQVASTPPPQYPASGYPQSTPPTAPFPSPPGGYQPISPTGYQQYPNYAPPGGIASIVPGYPGYQYPGALPPTWHYHGQGQVFPQQPPQNYPYQGYPYQGPPGGYPSH